MAWWMQLPQHPQHSHMRYIWLGAFLLLQGQGAGCCCVLPCMTSQTSCWGLTCHTVQMNPSNRSLRHLQ
jgi:hypothetical protein